MKVTDNNLNRLFFCLWILFALLQSAYTPLLNDEGYYWTFSQNLDWGYYDQPPFIAFLIKISCILGKSEFTVRLFPVLLSSAGLWLMQKTIKEFNVRFFWMVVFSCAALGYTSFISSPDSPLLFFTALYFYLIKQFIAKGWSNLNTLLFTLCLAGMMYTKYHGAFVILSSFPFIPGVFKQARFYVAVIFSVLLYFPHLWWLYNHDFVTLKFHLLHRAKDPAHISYVFLFLAGHLALFGGLASIPFHFVIRKFKTFNAFERICVWTYAGVVGFFLYNSFTTRTESNWTASAVIPFTLLVVTYAKEVPLRFLSVITVVLIVLVRIFFTVPFNSYNRFITKTLFEAPELYETVYKKAGNTPVVFGNSYKRAANYEFKYGVPAFSYTTVEGRMSMYNYWPREQELQDKKVMFIANYNDNYMDSVFTPSGVKISFAMLDHFSSFCRINCTIPDIQGKITPLQKMEIPVDLTFQPGDTAYLAERFMRPHLSAVFFKDNKPTYYRNNLVPLTREIILANKAVIPVEFPEKPGNYELYVGLNAGWQSITYNTNPVEIKVEP